MRKGAGLAALRSFSSEGKVVDAFPGTRVDLLQMLDWQWLTLSKMQHKA
jgi:hypothetical protein